MIFVFFALILVITKKGTELMRKPRILQEDATYHITAKINRGEHLFESDETKSLFIDVVKRAKMKYKFSIKNFVIMDNHIHFLIEPKDNLSRIMQWILSVFAVYYNKMYKLTGHC